MKLLVEMIASDFDKHSVWECWYASDDRLVVAPTDKTETRYEHDSDSPAVDVVRARFFLSNGSELSGLCMPHEYIAPEYYQPALITPQGMVSLYRDGGWTNEDRAAALNRLGLKMHEVFPIRFTTEVNFDGAQVTGLIVDFDKCKGCDE